MECNTHFGIDNNNHLLIKKIQKMTCFQECLRSIKNLEKLGISCSRKFKIILKLNGKTDFFRRKISCVYNMHL